MTSPSKPWRRFIRASLLLAASLASLPLRLGETSAFTSRRFHLAAIAVMSPMAARAELSPPLERVTKRYAEKIQGAMDFLYFDIKPYVRGGPRLFQLAINALDTSNGSNTALERDLFAPLRQLVLAGEEDGEVDFRPASQKIEASAKALTAAARDRQVDEAVAASDVLIADLSSLFTSVNKEAGSKVFLLPNDPDYETRLDAYRSRMAEGKTKNLMKTDD
ncbi:unnamed protein product [Durusdinium trenchii]|uniref:Uncharacterized protein n=2 Tax=Durusdinium trenchii TaxID=1381693 RepID=A0ABP0NE57_9DINO